MVSFSVKSAALLSAIWSATAVRAIFDCNVVVDGQSLNLTGLAGPHTVMTSRSTPPSTTTMTWTIDLCAALQPNDQVAANLQCAAGTQVCGIQTIAIEGQPPVVAQVIPVSGDLNGATAQNEVRRASGVNAASAQNGDLALNVVLAGGMWADSNDLTTNIDFVCDTAIVDHTPTATGTPGLTVKSWDEKTLALQWNTNVVCDQQLISIAQSEHSTAWSVIKYILIAALIILVAYFGITAYVNYSKGATGVDLLPSSEAILDIPYVARDFAKKIGGGLSTNTGRDGYAVF